MSRLGFWWSEVLRRRVLRVAAWYLAGAWVLAQVADLLFDAFDLSGYTRLTEESGDEVARIMLSLLDCPRLAEPARMTEARRDSLEVKCNLR